MNYFFWCAGGLTGLLIFYFTVLRSKDKLMAAIALAFGLLIGYKNGQIITETEQVRPVLADADTLRHRLRLEKMTSFALRVQNDSLKNDNRVLTDKLFSTKVTQQVRIKPIYRDTCQ